MDIERQRTQDDLRGIIQGDVFCDPVMTQLYASDASIYQVQPMGVVRPQTNSDVIAAVQYAKEHEISLHPRGAGSGVAGESLGRGLVIDFSRYMRRVEISADATTVNVQSGAVLADVNRSLRARRRGYGPDPVTRSITTMGSVLATNATGSHFLRSGTARDTIESARVVTVDGELIELAKHSPSDDGTAGRFALGLSEIQQQFAPQLAKSSETKARGGYRIDDIVGSDGRVDLAKFIVGTQGTLAIVVDATVRTETIATHRGVVLLFYHRMELAARGAVSALRHGLVACDLMDRRLLQIARDTDPRYADILPAAAEAMVLLEIQGESLGELYDRLAIIQQDLCSGHEGAFASVDTVKQSERDLYWALSRRVIPRMYRFKRGEAPVPFIEDLTVPRDRLPETLTAIQDTLKREQTTATFFSHVGHGHLHLRPFLDLSKASDRRRLARLSTEIAEVVWQHGGQVSVEHAAGLSRTYLLPKQFGELWQAMGQVKRLFDPMHRLNPGKLFGAVLQKPNENLRPADQTIEVTADNRVIVEADHGIAAPVREANRSVPQLQVLQHWPASSTITSVARGCNGCGRCRTTSPDERQCPVFRASMREEATPRAKANLLRAVIAGKLRVDDLATDQAKEIADLCFNCHQCRLDCPASVDIPKIVGELKAQYVATNGLPLSDALIGRIDTVAAFASRVPWLSNFLIQNSFSRWLAERLFGLSAARRLPGVVRETYLRYATGRRWHRRSPHGGLKVAYFVDQYANFHDPDIGRALAEVLQQNEIGLYVPTAQSASGMARFTSGDLKGARRIAKRNTRLLADAVRAGYTILATEPSAVLCLKHEYPNLLDDEDAHLVAEHSHEACEFLWGLHKAGRLSTEFQSVDASIAYHQPCHLRVLDPIGCAPQLLKLIPGMDVQHIEAGCSGMAGTWGLQKKNYRNSLRIGWPLISAMRSAKVTSATTECSACKMQIEHGSGQATLHPIKILAYAYGRMPKIGSDLEGTS
ncbi:FAD-binding protein [Rubripirellula amarantea]|nr:FAD-binding protein [Rubripirellula amarantea]